MTTSPTSIRLDDTLKRAAAKELNTMGLSMNTYLNMALRQLVLQKRIPFEVYSQPTEETERALITARAKELGILPDDSPVFDHPDDALWYLNDED